MTRAPPGPPMTTLGKRLIMAAKEAKAIARDEAHKRLRSDERFAIDAVAAEFSGTWKCGENPPDAYLTAGGREIAVEISTLTQQPRTSDDMAAVGLVGELNRELGGLVPKGVTIFLTLSAPMVGNRKKTKVALANFLREKLGDMPFFSDEARFDANGNVVTIRPIQGRKGRAKIFCSILPRTSNADIRFNAWQILEKLITRKTKTCGDLVGEKPLWLALLNDYPLAGSREYKDVLSKISRKHPFEKILLVTREGTVEPIFELGGKAI
jgi:hypothetical protein